MKKIIVAAILWSGIFGLQGDGFAKFCDFNDKEYMVVFSKGISWEEAKAEIEGWGSSYHLATIASREKQRYLQSLLRGLRGEFWIGGHQDGQNRWQWVSGEPWGFTKWGKKEPNDFYGNDSEQYLAIWGKYHKNRWIWNDEGNLKKISGYIVEREIEIHATQAPIISPIWLLGSGLALLMGIPRAARKSLFAGQTK